MWRFPLVRILPFFVAGIITAHCFDVPTVPILACGVLGLLAAIVFSAARIALIIASITFLLGYFNTILRDETRRSDHYLHSIDGERHSFTGRISRQMRDTERYRRFVAEIATVDGKASRGSLLVGFQKGKSIPCLLPGDPIAFTGMARKAALPLNPGQFDYGRYLANKSIHATVYLPDTSWASSGIPRRSVSRTAAQLHQTVERRLRQSGMAETELQVLMALILGKQQDIPKETLQDYQYAGAVHILSVSGLHVGLLLAFVYLLLKPLPNTKRWNLLRFAAVTAFLWTFAAIAGLSPSVVRSATMFSFVAAATLLRKDGNVLHTLFVSMLLILIVEPSFLFDAGFQLSYLSLFFIIWLQPAFAKLYQPRNKVLGYFWNLLTVSFSAQLGVLPLSLYYFHQFPGLFFLTNLIVLPALGIVMGAGLVVVVYAAFHTLPSWMVALVDGSLSAMNSVIRTIAGMDRFVFTDIPFNAALLLAGYFMLWALGSYLGNRNAVRLALLGMSVLFLQGATLRNELAAAKKEFLVLQSPRNTDIIVRKGKTAFRYHFGKKERPEVAGAYFTSNFIGTVRQKASGNHFFFSGKKIFRMDSTAVIAGRPDILILTQSPRINLERLLRTAPPETVVADGSNYKSYVARWKATCLKMKIPFHATAEKGFYRLE